MENQAKTEYDCVKILREVQIMNELNNLTQKLHSSIPTNQIPANENIRSTFVPEVLDIICLGNPQKSQTSQYTDGIPSKNTCPSSNETSKSKSSTEMESKLVKGKFNEKQ